MTTPLSNRRSGELSHRQANRLSRRFAEVGVHIPAQRLQELAAGAGATEDERIDVTFALMACEIQREDHCARLTRARRGCSRCLLLATATLAALLTLIGMALLIFGMALQLPQS